MEIGTLSKIQGTKGITSLKRKITSSKVEIPRIKAIEKKRKKKETMSVYGNSLKPTTNTPPPNTGWKTHFKGEVSSTYLQDGPQFREST